MWVVTVAALAVLLGACAAGDPPPGGSSASAAVSPSMAPMANACPTEGCIIKIVDVARSGNEIAVSWETNFAPDVSKNHVHVYWDTYTSDQVSSDAEARGVKQGEWIPTDVETFVTKDVLSVDNRGDSTTICVTAGDRNHAVIDSSIVDCRDVSDLL